MFRGTPLKNHCSSRTTNDRTASTNTRISYSLRLIRSACFSRFINCLHDSSAIASRVLFASLRAKAIAFVSVFDVREGWVGLGLFRYICWGIRMFGQVCFLFEGFEYTYDNYDLENLGKWNSQMDGVLHYTSC